MNISNVKRGNVLSINDHNNRKYIIDGLVTGSIWLAPALCKRLSLHPQFFNALHRQSYKSNVKIS